jgi:hypothetical protein
MLYQLSQGNREKIEQNIELINLFQDAANSLKTAVYPTLPLEIAVAKYCLTDSFDKPDKASMEESKTNVEVIRTTKPAQAEPLKGASSQPKKNYKNSSISLNQIASKWDEILSGVKPFNHSLEALLRSTRPIECDGAKVTIEVFYQFHKDQLEQDRHRRQIEQVISDIFDLPAIENVSGKLKDEDLAQAAEEIFGS